MTKRELLAVVLVVVPLVACGGLSDVNKADLVNAARLSAMGYQHQEAGTAGAALDRGAYCAVSAVLRDQKITPVVDGGIQCQP